MNPLLSIIVPVYNEERTIAQVMVRIVVACPDAEILYIDDGSEDASRAIIATRKRAQDQLLTPPHAGKGSAVRLGLRRARGAYTIIQDADCEYDPAQIEDLLQEAQEHPGSAVFGSRFLKSNPNIYKRFLIGNKVLTHILNLCFGGHLTDSYTCYKLLPTTLFRALPLTATGFELEAQIAIFCLKAEIPIREIPIRYSPRSIAQGKKISWRDAWKGLTTILRLRLTI